MRRHASARAVWSLPALQSCCQYCMPHVRSFDDPAQMEEERRLAYVGVTRAKDRLYLLRAFRRAMSEERAP